MQTIFITLQVILGLMLVILILLQGGADDLKGFGSSSVDNVMTPATSASFITKLTAVLAVLFMINCLVLANLYSRESRHSIADKIAEQQLVAKAQQAAKGVPLAN